MSAAQKSTGEKEALVVYKGTLKGIPVVACAFDFGFMAGSMGAVVGARFVEAVHECKERRFGLFLPQVVRACKNLYSR